MRDEMIETAQARMGASRHSDLRKRRRKAEGHSACKKRRKAIGNFLVEARDLLVAAWLAAPQPDYPALIARLSDVGRKAGSDVSALVHAKAQLRDLMKCVKMIAKGCESDDDARPLRAACSNFTRGLRRKITEALQRKLSKKPPKAAKKQGMPLANPGVTAQGKMAPVHVTAVVATTPDSDTMHLVEREQAAIALVVLKRQDAAPTQRLVRLM